MHAPPFARRGGGAEGSWDENLRKAGDTSKPWSPGVPGPSATAVVWRGAEAGAVRPGLEVGLPEVGRGTPKVDLVFILWTNIHSSASDRDSHPTPCSGPVNQERPRASGGPRWPRASPGSLPLPQRWERSRLDTDEGTGHSARPRRQAPGSGTRSGVSSAARSPPAPRSPHLSPSSCSHWKSWPVIW